MEIHGADIETVLGDLKLICTENRACEPETFEEVASFLLFQEGTKLYWTFNLQFDSEGIIKMLPFEKQKQLYKEATIIYNGFKILSFPKRLFSISELNDQGKVGRTAKLYDVAQYYQGMTLDSASDKYLHKRKLEGEEGENIGKELGKATGSKYYKDNRDRIILYCKNDSYLTMELGKHIMALFDQLAFPTKNPISCATISAKYVWDKGRKNKKDGYPGIKMLPEDFHALAQGSFRGGMFQTLQRGVFDQPLYDYDINSAYPAVMVTLPHWGNGRFEVIAEPSNAPYGWYMCEFDCPFVPYDSKKNWSFIQTIQDMELEFKATNHRIYYPTGERKQVITKAEYVWMLERNYPVKFLFGIEWNQEKNIFNSPFSWMESFYYDRQRQKKAGNYSIQYAMKIILNGLYGKTAQQKPEFGKLTNFFYASYITAKTRLQMATLLYENPNDIVNIATDGLVSSKKLSGIKISEKLGEWEYNEYTEGLFLGSGMYQVWFINQESSEEKFWSGYIDPFGNKKQFLVYSTKARGITDNRSWDMLKAMQENKSKQYLEFTKQRPLHFGEIIAHHKKLKPEWLNVFMDVTKKMQVNTDKNHIWDREYKNFGDLLENKSKGRAMTMEEIP